MKKSSRLTTAAMNRAGLAAREIHADRIGEAADLVLVRHHLERDASADHIRGRGRSRHIASKYTRLIILTVATAAFPTAASAGNPPYAHLELPSIDTQLAGGASTVTDRVLGRGHRLMVAGMVDKEVERELLGAIEREQEMSAALDQCLASTRENLGLLATELQRAEKLGAALANAEQEISSLKNLAADPQSRFASQATSETSTTGTHVVDGDRAPVAEGKEPIPLAGASLFTDKSAQAEMATWRELFEREQLRAENLLRTVSALQLQLALRKDVVVTGGTSSQIPIVQNKEPFKDLLPAASQVRGSLANEAKLSLNGELTYETTSKSNAKPGREQDRLLDKARTLLTQGDIVGARATLQYTMEAGNSWATFMLAQTYDPRMLRSWQTFGMRGDTRKALELYQKAADAGIDDAAANIEALKQTRAE
jgi:hypothetical protein